MLLGPSGSGKSLTLRAIAGLLKPDRGRIEVPDGVVFDSAQRVNLPPQARNVGYVVQNLALFPHLIRSGEHRLRDRRLAAPEARNQRIAS